MPTRVCPPPSRSFTPDHVRFLSDLRSSELAYLQRKHFLYHHLSTLTPPLPPPCSSEEPRRRSLSALPPSSPDLRPDLSRPPFSDVRFPPRGRGPLALHKPLEEKEDGAEIL